MTILPAALALSVALAATLVQSPALERAPAVAQSPALERAPTPTLALAPPREAGEHARGETRCGGCHTADGWDRVTFDHARTGFPLEGQHRKADCRGCHAGSDFKKAVARACVACHRDVHAGRLGTRCQDCHDAVTWKEQLPSPDAHRRSNFPLDGRHAVLPCEECHGDRRDRGFSRPTRRCVSCHQADLASAAATSFDHSALGPAPDCRHCHGAWRFTNAYLTGHDACFPIRTGRHSGYRCLQCHTTLAGAVLDGTCSTATASCQRCHSCANLAGAHSAHPGFCADQACYGCHPRGVHE